MTDEMRHEKSSGNVFLDLGFDEAEAAALAVKSDLAIEIMQTVEALGLTQEQAARRVGVDQPTLSKVLRGRTEKVSQERLTRWLAALGCDVTIKVSRTHAAKGSVRVEPAST